MKITSLIASLNQIFEEYGDIKVLVQKDPGPYSMEGVISTRRPYLDVKIVNNPPMKNELPVVIFL